MKKFMIQFLLVLPLLTSCDYFANVEKKFKEVDKYERAALNLAKENRMLLTKINELKFKVNELKAKNKFYEIRFNRSKKRSPAAIKKAVDPKNDLVKFTTYNWTEKDLYRIAQNSLQKKDFVKASQYYQTLFQNYPSSSLINDKFLFKAGMSSFESGKYFKWSQSFMDELLKKYPTSPFFRGAKLWRALSFYKMGNTKDFYSTVEEFRIKYRNTPEWKILSQHYEELTHRYKN